MSADCLSYRAEAEELSNMPRCGHVPGSTGSNAYNTGMMILRNRPATLNIMREWHLRLASPNECVSVTSQSHPPPLQAC